MQIAHVSDCYLPRTGGIEIQVRGLSQAQLQLGDRPRVLTATPAERGRPVIVGESDRGVAIHRLALDLPAGLPISPYIGRRAAELMAQCDVVHVHAGLISPFAWPVMRTAVQAGMPCVVTVHSMWSGWSGALRAAGGIVNWRRWPVVWTTVSAVAAAAMHETLGPNIDIQTLPNGIDVQRWAATDLPTRQEEPFTVVAVTRLAMRKRAGALVEILDRARSLVPTEIPMRAVLIGDGPDHARISRMLRNRGMDWVECPGWRNHSEIKTYFGHSDVFLNVARLESFGIAALEARTFGLPVVALASSGVAEFVTDGREGLLADDDEGLARAIAKLATYPRQTEAISSHNREVPPAFAWPDVVAATAEHYREALSLVGG